MDKLQQTNDTISNASASASRWVELVGWVLVGIALNGVLFASLPVKLIDPAWQLGVISAILSTGGFLLVGSLLAYVAQLLNPRSNLLQKRLHIVRIGAGWFTVLLLLIIPFQFYAGYRVNGIAQENDNQSIQQINKIIHGVTASDDEAELRSFFASLPTPPPVPARFEAPFPVIKQRLLTFYSDQFNAATYQSGILNIKRLERFIAEASRNAVHAFLLAIGFAGLAEHSGPLFGLFMRLGLFRYRD